MLEYFRLEQEQHFLFNKHTFTLLLWPTIDSMDLLICSDIWLYIKMDWWIELQWLTAHRCRCCFCLNKWGNVTFNVMFSTKTIAQSDIYSEVKTLVSAFTWVPKTKTLTPSFNRCLCVTVTLTWKTTIGVDTSLLSLRPCWFPWPRALRCKTKYKQQANVQCRALYQWHVPCLWCLYFTLIFFLLIYSLFPTNEDRSPSSSDIRVQSGFWSGIRCGQPSIKKLLCCITSMHP